MKLKILFLTFLVGCTLFSYAEAPGMHRQRMRNRAINNNVGNWAGRMGQTDEFAKYVGLTGEQKKKLRNALGKIQAQHARLSDQVRKEAAEQAKLCQKMLETPNRRDPRVFKKIEIIANYRTKQAKLAIESLIILRDSLTKEQYPKAKKFFRNEIVKRRRMHPMGNNPNPRVNNP